jgi:hypothetical protein
MSGSVGLSPSRNRKPEGSTLSAYARNLKKECAGLVAGQAALIAEIRTAYFYSTSSPPTEQFLTFTRPIRWWLRSRAPIQYPARAAGISAVQSREIGRALETASSWKLSRSPASAHEWSARSNVCRWRTIHKPQKQADHWRPWAPGAGHHKSGGSDARCAGSFGGIGRIGLLSLSPSLPWLIGCGGDRATRRLVPIRCGRRAALRQIGLSVSLRTFSQCRAT